MPRILVADDNSNIHRAVALALKEAGVEVVAVGNGEAAVRKIAEIKPDLVLADIFMPVRSGYEVCEFVKQDPRFTGVPVVLLIGAFDPFDEREAQRVQADAILKKPFVPPDSLVRTVADLLAQSASRVSPAPVAAAVTQAERPTKEPEPAPYMDQAPEELAPAKARLEWDSDTQPVAFGTLLETPAAESETEDSVMTSRRDPNLGEPAFWTPKAQADAEQGEADSEEPTMETSVGFGDEEQWRSGAGLVAAPEQSEAISEIAQPESSLELPENTLELPELISTASQLSATPAELLQEVPEPLPALPTMDLLPTENAVALPTLDSFSDTPQVTQESEVVPDTISDVKDFAWATSSYPAEQAGADSHSEHSESDAEILPPHAEESTDVERPALATLAPFLASLTSAASAREGAEPLDPLAFDSVPAFPAEFRSDSPEPEPAESPAAPAASQLDPAAIEAIAQRVIDRMQPKIIELVTRELLRPAVEALVQHELEKK